jgi:hypothetical protein
MTMSARITFAALAGLLTTLSVQGTAFAQSFSTTFHATSEHRASHTVNRSKARMLSNTFGSVDAGAGTSFGRPLHDVVFGGSVLGRDPDQNVRFEILRDKDRGN